MTRSETENTGCPMLNLGKREAPIVALQWQPDRRAKIDVRISADMATRFHQWCNENFRNLSDMLDAAMTCAMADILRLRKHEGEEQTKLTVTQVSSRDTQKLLEFCRKAGLDWDEALEVVIHLGVLQLTEKGMSKKSDKPGEESEAGHDAE